MERKLKIGILKETKIPIDKRTPFSPKQVQIIQNNYPDIDIVVQASNLRCYSDSEYRSNNIVVTNDMNDCDILFGVKEVDYSTLIPGKTYIFFSHTAKKQPHNRKLLQEIVKKNITLIDYEYLVDDKNVRFVAFGFWAGVVGAYNGIIGLGIRNKLFDIEPAHKFSNYSELKLILHKLQIPAIKILITGEGRVATGTEEILKELGIMQINVIDFLNSQFQQPVYCKIGPKDYVKHKDGNKFDFNHFIHHPSEYISDFNKYCKVTDVYMACHYWDPKSPVLITNEIIQNNDFKISLIADISCDQNGPIASTIRSSTIEKPFYGYDKKKNIETDPFSEDAITVMAVDNLPGELPRDASEDFGDRLIAYILDVLINNNKSKIIDRATIVKGGVLTLKFNYLKDYLEGKE